MYTMLTRLHLAFDTKRMVPSSNPAKGRKSKSPSKRKGRRSRPPLPGVGASGSSSAGGSGDARRERPKRRLTSIAGDARAKWRVLKALFGVMTHGVKDCPTNRFHLWREDSWKSLAAALRMTKISRCDDYADKGIDILVALATERLSYFDQDDVHEDTKTKAVPTGTARPAEVIQNPLAIVILLDMAQSMALERQIKVLSRVASLVCGPDAPVANVGALTRVHTLGILLDKFPIFIFHKEKRSLWDLLAPPGKDASNTAMLQNLILRLVVALASHRVHAVELKMLIHMFPQPLLNQLCLRLACGPVSAHFIALDAAQKGHACVYIPQLTSRDAGWPKDGFSWSGWINIQRGGVSTPAQPTQRDSKAKAKSPARPRPPPPQPTPVHLLRIESNNRAVCQISIQNGKFTIFSDMSVGPNNADSKTASRENNFSAAAKNTLVKVAEIPQFEFCARRWYHVCIRYETRFRKGGGVRLSVERKGSSSISRECGCLTLWVDGAHIGTAVIPKGLTVQSNTIGVQAYIGTPPRPGASTGGAAEKINRGQGSAWWLGPTVMLEGSISDAFVAEIFKRGHTYRGCFHPREAVVDEPGTAGDPRGSPSDATVCPRNRVMFAFSAMYRMNIDAVDALLAQAEQPHPSRNRARSRIGGSSTWHWTETDSKRVASLLASARTDVGNLLYNAVSSGAPPAPGSIAIAMPAGYLAGGATCIHSRGVADALRSASGVSFLFPPIAHSPNTKSLNEALLLLSLVLHRNRANMSELKALDGYRLLARVLKEKAEKLSWTSLDIIFSLVEGRDPITGARRYERRRDIAALVDLTARRPWRSWAPPVQRDIADMKAVRCVLLDWQVWTMAPAALQASLFARLAQLCLWGPRDAESQPGVPMWRNAVQMQKNGCLAEILHLMLQYGHELSDSVVDAVSCLVEALMTASDDSLRDIGALVSYLAVGVSDEESQGSGAGGAADAKVARSASAPSAMAAWADGKEGISENHVRRGFLLLPRGNGAAVGGAKQAPLTPRIKMGLSIINVLTGIVVAVIKPPASPLKAKRWEGLLRLLNKRWFGMFLSPQVHPQVLEAVLCLLHVVVCGPGDRREFAVRMSGKILNTIGFAVPYFVPSWTLYTALFAVVVQKTSETLIARSDSLSKLRAKKLFRLAAPDAAMAPAVDRRVSLAVAFDVFVLSQDLLSNATALKPNLQGVTLLLHLLELDAVSLLKPVVEGQTGVMNLLGSDNLPESAAASVSASPGRLRLPVTAIRFFNLLVHQSDAIKAALWDAPDPRVTGTPASSNLAIAMRGSPMQQAMSIWFQIASQHKRIQDSLGITQSQDAKFKDTTTGAGGDAPKGTDLIQSDPISARTLASCEVLDSLSDLMCTVMTDLALNAAATVFARRLGQFLQPPQRITARRLSIFRLRLFGQLAVRLERSLSDASAGAHADMAANCITLSEQIVRQMQIGAIQAQAAPLVDLRSRLGMVAPKKGNREDASETDPDVLRAREQFFVCRVVEFIFSLLEFAAKRLEDCSEPSSEKDAKPAVVSPSGHRASSSGPYEMVSKADTRRQVPARVRSREGFAAAESCQAARACAVRLFICVCSEYGGNAAVLRHLFRRSARERTAKILFDRWVVGIGNGVSVALDVLPEDLRVLEAYLHQHLRVGLDMSGAIQCDSLRVWRALVRYQKMQTGAIMTPPNQTHEEAIVASASGRGLIVGFRKLLRPPPSDSDGGSGSSDGKSKEKAREFAEFRAWYADNCNGVDAVFAQTLAPSLSAFLELRAKVQVEAKSAFNTTQAQNLQKYKEQERKMRVLVVEIDQARRRTVRATQASELQRQTWMVHTTIHRKIKMRGIYQSIALRLVRQTHAAGPPCLPLIPSHPATERSLQLYHHFLPLSVVDPYHAAASGESARDSDDPFAPLLLDGVRLPYALDSIEGPLRQRKRMVGLEEFFRIYGIDQTNLVSWKTQSTSKPTQGAAATTAIGDKREGGSPAEPSPNKPAIGSGSEQEPDLKHTAAILRRTAGRRMSASRASASTRTSGSETIRARRSSQEATSAFKKASRLSTSLSSLERLRDTVSTTTESAKPEVGGEGPNTDSTQERERPGAATGSATTTGGRSNSPTTQSRRRNRRGSLSLVRAIRKQSNAMTRPGSDPVRSAAGAAPLDTPFDGDSTETGDLGWSQILRLLPPGESENVTQVVNCARIAGLIKHEGVLFVSKTRLFLVENYKIIANELTEITEQVEEAKVEFTYFVCPVAPEADPGRDAERLGPRLQVKRFRDPKAQLRRKQLCLSHVDRHACRDFAYGAMREIRKRRYQLQRVALEFFNEDGSSALLAFDDTQTRDEVFSRILSVGVPSSTSEMRMGMGRHQALRRARMEATQSLINRALVGQKSMSQQWQDGEISNFAYLMFLNTLAGRSYNDLTQYPVFPWVLKDYTSDSIDLKDPNVYRDLSKPMGAIGDKRKIQFLERYKSWEDEIIPKFHYGTHYASAATTLYYLLRLEPFTRVALQLQGGKFDHADRLFYSVQNSWHLSSAEGGMSDVKELIPEFYYLPDFLQNSNRFNFGKTQFGTHVHDVELPPWARGDPRRFVKIMRAALESEEVSKNLHNWIDLIFGYKQQGKAAEEAQNVFYYLTYEDRIDIESIADPVDKMSIIAQINNFGQTPHQIFKKPHPARKQTAIPMTLSTHVNILIPSGFVKYPARVRQMEWGLDGKLTVACGHFALVPPKYKQYIQWGNPDQSLRFVDGFDPRSAAARAAALAPDGVLAVYGGIHHSQTTCALVTHDGARLVTGGEDAVVSVWAMPQRLSSRTRPRPLRRLASLVGHSAAVSCLCSSLDHHVLVSGGYDGQAIIWDLNALVLQRRLPRHPGPVTCVAINHNTGDIVTCSLSWIFVWNPNGDLCAVRKTAGSKQQDITSVSFAAGPDVQIHPAVITGHEDGRINFWRLQFATPEQMKKTGGVLEPEFAGFPYAAPIQDTLCSSRNDIVVAGSTPIYVSEPRRRGLGAARTSTGSGDSKTLRGVVRDTPYMVLQPLERRKLHSAAVTSIHCSHHTWVRMWTGDEDGVVRAWKLTSDDHWVDDSKVEACPICEKAFGVLERRHHCRYCGGIFCNSCSLKKCRVPQFGHTDPVRVCDDCYMVLQAKNGAAVG